MIKALLVCSSLLFSIYVSAESIPGKFTPPPGKTYIFVGQDNIAIENYVKKVNDAPDGFVVYTAVNDIRGLFEGVNHGAGVNNANHWRTKYPQKSFQIGLYMVDRLQEVVEGKWDRNLGELARWIKESQVPVYLRIGYEFDLPDNRYDPEEYKKAFRYIVDFIRAARIDNVAFVWHSYGYTRPGMPWMNWYPGDNYVDWFGLSFFKVFNTSGYEAFLKLAREHGKPMMLAEATPFGTGTLNGQKSWDMWFAPFFEFIEANDIPMVCYINSDWETKPMFSGQGWGNARIDENGIVKGLWQEKIKESRFQHLKK